MGGALLMSAALAGCGIAYGLFVVDQQEYLTRRNFRLLSTPSDSSTTSSGQRLASLPSRSRLVSLSCAEVHPCA